MMRKHTVVIVGAGSGGISVAARLKRGDARLDVAVIDPSDKHYYQPAWTLVGGGDFDLAATVREQASVIPSGVQWLRDAVASFDPGASTLRTRSGDEIGYEQLIVAPGIQLNWDAIPGLRQTLGKDGVCSNYSFDTVAKTWEFIQATRTGPALFTHPATPIKCGGAPQKIMYLACDHWRRQGRLRDIPVIFGIASPDIFAVPRYAGPLVQVAARYGVDVRYKHDLKEVRPQSREAVFRITDGGEFVTRYELLHVTPPMSAPDFVRNSPLVDGAGWVEVDRSSLRHARFQNVWALGDASNLPTSKTGAAIRAQAPVLATNLLAVLRGGTPTARYDGYTSCPLVTGYGRLILAEFDYDKQPKETFPFDQSKERRSMYLLKKHLLPRLYWSGMLKGRA